MNMTELHKHPPARQSGYALTILPFLVRFVSITGTAFADGSYARGYPHHYSYS